MCRSNIRVLGNILTKSEVLFVTGMRDQLSKNIAPKKAGLRDPYYFDKFWFWLDFLFELFSRFFGEVKNGVVSNWTKYCYLSFLFLPSLENLES